MKHFLVGAMLLGTFAFMASCNNDDDTNTPATEARAQFEITDGPIDDSNVQGAFVTVTAVRVDGQVINGFAGAQTIDLMAYQNGNTQVLGLAELEAGTYSDVTLVLDYDKDANGNSPGCYVLTSDNVKHDLQATANSTSDIKLNSGSFQVENGSTTHVVLDFDLRKAIRYEDAPQSTDQYDLVTDAELNTTVRLVSKSQSGKVHGQVDDNLGMGGDQIVVFAYKKGEFNKSTEVQGQGTSQIQFKNSVSSTSVDGQGNYTLAFLEAGDYELHFFAFEDTDQDGKLELLGELELSLIGNPGFNLNSLTVGAKADVSANVLVTGLLP